MSELNFPSAPIAWATNIVIDLVLKICLVGDIEKLNFRFMLENNKLELSCDGITIRGFSQVFQTAMNDDECSPLVPLLIAPDLDEKEVAFRMYENSFELRVEHRIDQFEIMEDDVEIADILF